MTDPKKTAKEAEPKEGEDTAEEIIDVPDETTEIVEHEGFSPALAMDDADFLEQEEAEDDDDAGGIDRICIDQKGEDEGAEKGKFFCKNTKVVYEPFPAVLLRREKSRILWPEKYKKDNEYLCKSNDGINPVTDDDIFTPKAKSCKTCAYGKWKRNGKENIPPRCMEVVDMILLNLEDLMPYIFSVHSTLLGATNQGLMKVLRRRKKALTIQRKRAGLPPAHWCMFSFNLGTELKKNDAGNAFIPTYSDITDLEPNQVNAMVHAAKSVKDLDIHFSGNMEDDENDSGERSEEEGAFDEVPTDEEGF